MDCCVYCSVEFECLRASFSAAITKLAGLLLSISCDWTLFWIRFVLRVFKLVCMVLFRLGILRFCSQF
ncbi:hypothetical protein BDV06DRAFT_31771 [Aspergillus oleicola]